MEFIVEQSGQRIDRFLADKAPSISRSQWQKNIKGGAIRINGHYVIQPGFKLRADDRVVVLEEKILGKDGEFVIVPQGEIPLGIIYEDDDLVVVNKPAGLLTHPTLSHRKNTLVNALIARYPQMVEVGENPLRPGIVHRLDKDTSGLLAAAKNQKAFLYLKEQFLKRTVEKKYLALVEGVPKESEGV
ncbi:MAG: RluA family pseudouridine synthase, partial [Parcubacteria group bacterium]|nr:RluA family pseudouridine synthase [Parcubacteria group bacterium]